MNTQIIIDHLDLRGCYWNIKDKEGDFWLIVMNGNHIYNDSITFKDTEVGYFIMKQWIFINADQGKTLPEMIEHLGGGESVECESLDVECSVHPREMKQRINDQQKQIDGLIYGFNLYKEKLDEHFKSKVNQQKQITNLESKYLNADRCFDEYDKYTRNKLDDQQKRIEKLENKLLDVKVVLIDPTVTWETKPGAPSEH